jgi:hypothetical protein
MLYLEKVGLGFDDSFVRRLGALRTKSCRYGGELAA